jgi:hypothetical protein
MKPFKTMVVVGVLAASTVGLYLYSANGGVAQLPIGTAWAEHLFDELTTTPDRQQVAMDELVTAGEAALPYMFVYLNDKRSLATSNVRFLNSSPRVSEKYFNTTAVSMDELTLRYLCWRTAACDFDYKKISQSERRAQTEKILAWCRLAYAGTVATCDTSKLRSDSHPDSSER